MNDILAMVLVWQVVLLGGWALSRRLVRLERTFRSPCYGQVGALREQVVSLRTDQAFDVQEQDRRLQDIEESLARTESGLRTLIQQQEKQSRTLLDRVGQLEESLRIEMASRLASSGS